MISYKYEGEFRGGNMNGKGMLIYSNGDWYKGKYY